VKAAKKLTEKITHPWNAKTLSRNTNTFALNISKETHNSYVPKNKK